jgi:hypothetical protein
MPVRSRNHRALAHPAIKNRLPSSADIFVLSLRGCHMFLWRQAASLNGLRGIFRLTGCEIKPRRVTRFRAWESSMDGSSKHPQSPLESDNGIRIWFGRYCYYIRTVAPRLLSENPESIGQLQNWPDGHDRFAAPLPRTGTGSCDLIYSTPLFSETFSFKLQSDIAIAGRCLNERFLSLMRWNCTLSIPSESPRIHMIDANHG